MKFKKLFLLLTLALGFTLVGCNFSLSSTNEETTKTEIPEKTPIVTEDSKTPTKEPSVEETKAPSKEETLEPTVEPTIKPTEEPTVEPTIEPTEEPTPEVLTYTDVKDIYNLDLGTEVLTKGIVTGILDNQFYISLGDSSILVYLDKDKVSNYPCIKDNYSITVKGIVGSFQGIKQIKEVSEINPLNEALEATYTIINSGLQEHLEKYAKMLCSAEGLVIKSIPKKTTKDASFKVLLNGESVNVFLSHHIEKSAREALNNILCNAKVNDILKLDFFFIGSYNNTYQINLTGSTEVTKTVPEIKSLGLELNTKEISVEENTTLEALLSKIEVYEKFNDGSKVLLTSEEYQVDTNNYDSTKVDQSFIFTFTYKIYEAKVRVNIVLKGAGFEKKTLTEALYKEVVRSSNYSFVNTGIPTIGSPKVLVIPVAFTDYKAPKGMKETLEIAFNGTSEETGWESLNSYYLKSSYNKLNLTAVIGDVYNAPYSTRDIERMAREYPNKIDEYNDKINQGLDPGELPMDQFTTLINEYLKLNDKKYDYSDFDYDKDGYIDSVYIVYANPYEYHNDFDTWWAWTTSSDTNKLTYDNVDLGFYVTLSYETLYRDFHNIDIKLNCETIIHETGHALGLDDYYDFDLSDGDNGTVGLVDMMEANLGDHNSYSKTYLGWTNPYISNGKGGVVTLRSIGKTGDCLIIPKKYNGSLLSEYYIVEFFTPDGLNAVCVNDLYMGFTIPGVKIYHVDATVNSARNVNYLLDLLKYNNANTTHQLIKLMENNPLDPASPDNPAKDDDLFQVNDSFSGNWYDGSKGNFTLVVESMSKDEVSLRLSYK